MMLSEFGSTGIEEMSVFQALSAGNGMNPFRAAPGPVSIPAHMPFCAKLSLEKESNERPMRMLSCHAFIEPLLFSGGGGPFPPFEWHDKLAASAWSTGTSLL